MKLRSGRKTLRGVGDESEKLVEEFCKAYVLKRGEKEQLHQIVRQSKWWVNEHFLSSVVRCLSTLFSFARLAFARLKM